MAFRRRKVGRRMRKRTGGRRKKVSRINRVSSALLPTAFYTKLRYTERIILSPTLGAHTYRLFRGNSPFDPDFSGVGISALGFSTLAAQYYKYRVFGSNCQIRTVLNSSTPGPGAYELALVPVNNGFASTPTPEQMAMNPRGKFKLIGNSGGSQLGYLKSYCATSAIQGMKKIAVKILDEAGALVTTNPADTWFWAIGVQPSDHTSDQSIIVYIDITYFVKFEDRRPFTS